MPDGLHPVFKASLFSLFLLHAVANTTVMYVCDPQTLQLYFSKYYITVKYGVHDYLEVHSLL